MEVAGTSFGSFDIIVFIILGFSSLLAFMRGISRELVSMIALLIAVVGALFIFGRYQISFQSFIKPAKLADWTLGLSTFGILYILVSIILRGWAKTIRGRKPPFIDRLLGVGFGLARGLVLASLIVIFASGISSNNVPSEWFTSAKTYPVLRKISDTLENLPFARAKEIAEEIKDKGKESDILPDIPQEEHKQEL